MPADTPARILDLYFGGDTEAAAELAGQTAGLIDAVRQVREILEETVARSSRSPLVSAGLRRGATSAEFVA